MQIAIVNWHVMGYQGPSFLYLVKLHCILWLACTLLVPLMHCDNLLPWIPYNLTPMRGVPAQLVRV